MTTRHFNRSLHCTKQILCSLLSRSCISLSLSNRPCFSSSLLRLRPLVAVSASFHQLPPAATTFRCCSTSQTSFSLNDSNPESSNHPTGQEILLDGCDYKHWLVVMKTPEDDTSRDRDEIIDSYIKTLAMVVGSEEEARMKIYSVSTRHYYAFGALVSEELSQKLKELPRVQWVLPDSYADAEKKDYGGEPFINGQPVPYEPKYHESFRISHEVRTRKSDKSRNSKRKQNVQKHHPECSYCSEYLK